MSTKKDKLIAKVKNQLKQASKVESDDDIIVTSSKSSESPQKNTNTVEGISIYKNKMKLYMKRDNSESVLESATIIREAILDILSGKEKMDSSAKYNSSDILVSLVKSIKRIPVLKEERDKRFIEYFPPDMKGVKETVTYQEWVLASKILDVIDKRAPSRLSSASLVIALRPLVDDMCSDGLEDPAGTRGWLILSKGPYHFVKFEKIYESCATQLTMALSTVERVLKTANIKEMSGLITYNKNARPARQATEVLLGVTVRRDLLDIAFPSNPSHWLFAEDLRLPESTDGGLNAEEKSDFEVMAYDYCMTVVEFGAKWASPGLLNFVKRSGMLEVSVMKGKVAAIIADVVFIIASLKAPNGKLGRANRAIKMQDELIFTEYMKKENLKKRAENKEAIMNEIATMYSIKAKALEDAAKKDSSKSIK